ncbi:uncharacterized protein LOC124938406 [Impatiens glandulifera]|uniref:uncharacterized protein LOC124938406 n=1 Tax=Impatiens glandulifera TaxID=253017 RepID=UPI001FB105B2|nr:uncharacterized protein LOC124938406 [Impatiens glandulifera]
MINIARSASAAVRSGLIRSRFPFFPLPSSPLRRTFGTSNESIINPVAIQMINYALSLARSQKTDESFAQAQLVLEQCLSTQSDDNSKGTVLLSMSTLLSQRGNSLQAIEKLQDMERLSISLTSVRVAAAEALAGLYLELGQDGTASMVANVCLQLLDSIRVEHGAEYCSEDLHARCKAIKGLVKLASGDVDSAEPLFKAVVDVKNCTGNTALSYGEFFHVKHNLSKAKELYEKVLQPLSERNDFGNPDNLAASNMALEETLVAATCSLGQLEAHAGNFAKAEEILTRALTKAEDFFGSNHPKVGVVLTCIALMFRRKATVEHSSSLLIQEGLYRRAIDLLKKHSSQTEGEECGVARKDILALARGGYAEILTIQQNRKSEGEKMKSWAESAWKNQRLSLAEVLNVSDDPSSSKVTVIDTRISRAL